MPTIRNALRLLLRGLFWLLAAVMVGAFLVGAGWLLSRLLIWLGLG